MPADQVSAARPRPWLLIALGAAVVALVTYQLWPSAATGSGPSNRAGNTRPGKAGAVDPGALHVQLGALDQPPPEPSTGGRNPFRFEQKAPPSEAHDATRPAPAPILQPVEPLQPAGPAPIALKFFGVFDGRPGKIAALSDGRDVFYGREGEIIDGRYRIVKIGVESIVMEYPNGTGRQTIPLRGQ
jgi:hypothetical protein